MSEVTRILERAQAGDPSAPSDLLPLVYEELRRLAAAKMALERPGQTLQPTALVHEAWLKVAGSNEPRQWNGRSHFFRAAAEAMRRILIDQARRKARQKRGQAQPLEELDEAIVDLRAPSAEMLAIHESLDALAAQDPAAAEVVKLRYFVGLTIPETAAALGVSPRTADRHWIFARAWLKQEIQGGR